ncbi:Translation initiation factor IF-3 [Symbiodinium microadriaticum]|uniref:Translation initiation factor IF-3 n=1 Tax=Symbiodinium microadriaticum TaxID=2951 RepID=A0A1Q9D654_SYMMI|nr:Translation initiation factor IF-3 [Symbiodinium microadriaticum]
MQLQQLSLAHGRLEAVEENERCELLYFRSECRILSSVKILRLPPALPWFEGRVDVISGLLFAAAAATAEPDPPLVKIFSIGKYVYEEKKKAKELAKNKVPKIKEVKITYTIGDHDLNTKLRNIEKWLENKRQQVKVQCVMKGRSRMFEGQARSMSVETVMTTMIMMLVAA